MADASCTSLVGCVGGVASSPPLRLRFLLSSIVGKRKPAPFPPVRRLEEFIGVVVVRLQGGTGAGGGVGRGVIGPGQVGVGYLERWWMTQLVARGLRRGAWGSGSHRWIYVGLGVRSSKLDLMRGGE